MVIAAILLLLSALSFCAAIGGKTEDVRRYGFYITILDQVMAVVIFIALMTR